MSAAHPDPSQVTVVALCRRRRVVNVTDGSHGGLVDTSQSLSMLGLQGLRSATTAVTAVDTTGAKPAGGEARPPRIAKHMSTESVLAESLGEFHEKDGRSWSRTGTSSAAASTVVKPADETRPPEITEYIYIVPRKIRTCPRRSDTVTGINRSLSLSSASSCVDHCKAHTKIPFHWCCHVRYWMGEKMVQRQDLRLHHTFGWRQGRVHPLEAAGRYQGAETGRHSVIRYGTRRTQGKVQGGQLYCHTQRWRWQVCLWA